MATKTKLIPTVKTVPDDRRWQAHDAMRTLASAEQIKKDPKLMSDVNVLLDDLKKASRGSIKRG